MATFSSQHLSTNRHDTHSTTTQGGSWSTKRIATLAILCAVALVTSFIEIHIFPPAPWLSFDPSGIVVLVAGVHLLFAFDPYGVLMAIISLVSLVAPASAIYWHKLNMRGAITGMIVGSICSIVVCILANLVITPLYTPIALADVIAMILPILLPFNLLKVVLISVITALIYKPISQAIAG